MCAEIALISSARSGRLPRFACFINSATKASPDLSPALGAGGQLARSITIYSTNWGYFLSLDTRGRRLTTKREAGNMNA